MNCREVQHRLFSGATDALSEADRSGLAAHVVTCSDCRRMQEMLVGAFTEWRAETSTVPVPDPDREWLKLRRELQRPAARSSRSMAAWIALPVAAAAAVAIGLYVSPGDTPPERPRVAASGSAVQAGTEAPSTVVYVDDKSGWTFVWASDTPGNGQPI